MRCGNTVVIGIHGLGNKPPRRLLRRWWRQALLEGLRREPGPLPFFTFELAYWADHLHPRPLTLRAAGENDPLFLREPYLPGKPKAARREGRFGERVFAFMHEQIDLVVLSEEFLRLAPNFSERMARKHFVEVEAYFASQPRGGGESLREASRGSLAAALERHRGRDIVLIAHSLGSLIAYDALSLMPLDVPVAAFVTIGSPLGIPYIQGKMKRERGLDPGAQRLLEVPDAVRGTWLNLADADDRVACHFPLNGRFLANRHGVAPQDAIVANDYDNGREANPHKSFGYLRCPELAALVRRQSATGKSRARLWLETRLNRWLHAAGIR